MKTARLILFLAILLLPAFCQPETKVYFSPQDRCDRVVVSCINKSSSTLDIAIFTLTLDSISDAIVNAYNRGVKVRIIADYRQSTCKGSDIERLEKLGIPLIRARAKGFMHNKYAVIDSSVVITGSFNFTTGAVYRNDENLVILNDAGPRFKESFNGLWRKYNSRLLRKKSEYDK